VNVANDTALTYSLYGKDVSASKALKGVGDAAEKAHGHFANLKTTALGVFAGNLLTQGASSLVGSIGSAVQAAADYQKLGFQTAAVLKSTGNAANTSVEGIQKLAGELESLSGVDEALIINSENVLATFTKVNNGVGAGNDVFDQATKAALNMSSALGTDLQGSTIQIGKALNDPIKGITALSRAGVSFTEQQKEQIKQMVKSGDTLGAQKLILGELTTEFGGAAEAAGKGFGGSMARLKDTVADASRDIATKFLPTITNIADGLSMLLKGDLGGFTNKMKEIGDQAKEFGINVITKLRESWPMIKAEFLKWGTAAITWIQEAIPKFYEKYGEFVLALFARITETLPGLLDKVAKWRDAFVAWVPGAITKLLENVSKLGAKLSEWISLHGADLVADLVQWAIAFAGFALKSLPGLLLNLGKVIIAIGKWIITDGVPMLIKLAFNLGKAIIDGVWEGISKATSGFTEKITNWFKENVIGGVKKLLGIASPSKVFEEIGDNVVKGFENGLSKISAESIAIRFGKMVETINTKLNDELDKAKASLESARQDFDNFASGTRGSINGGINFVDALAGSKESGKNLIDSLSGQADKAKAFASRVSTLLSMGFKQSGIQQVLNAGADAGTEIADSLIAGGADAITKANGFLDAVDTVAKDLGAQGAAAFYASGVANGEAHVAGINAAIASSKSVYAALGQKAINEIIKDAGGKKKLDASDKEAIAAIAKAAGIAMPKLATGGIVTQPTVAMIGEAGPEAVIPLSKMAGSGLNVTINVTGSVIQERDLAVTVRDNIAQLMRRRGLNPSILGV
jgi:hypothetical protein